MQISTNLKFKLLLLCAIIAASCKSNYYIHEDINSDNYPTIFKSRYLSQNDTLWLSKRTACVVLEENNIKIGSVMDGKEKGKWFYYYIPERKDTIDCYFIEEYKKNDTIKVLVKTVNRSW